jgi:rhomboid family protein
MFPPVPPITRVLLVLNVVGFVLQQFLGDQLILWFALWPLTTPTLSPGPGMPAGFLPWQLITYSFLHSPDNPLHLLVNMLGLYMFGSEVERVLGGSRYFIYYFTSVLAAAIAQLVMSALGGGPGLPTIGASGGVFGLLLAYGMFFPRRIVVLIFPPIPLPARVFVIVYAVLELYLGVTGTQAGVAHFAHLGGMLGGFILLRMWRRRRRPG